MLPIDFLERMKTMLGAEYEEFYQSYERERYYGLRVNTLKADIHTFLEQVEFSLRPVPWTSDGFYYEKEDAPGKHPYHEAGVYYSQEPSAMLPAQLLQAAPGDFVLDLCAAPGGKSTAIAAGMKGEGILVSNEIHPLRAKALSENIERMGIRNAIVTNEAPERLADIFAGYFDKIMVDAPCSGEGMFRKNKAACEEWSLDRVAQCAERQEKILSHAARMLREGGRLVYSTCTFSKEENEDIIDSFLSSHPDFELLQTERMWPHKIQGEGHFAACLCKRGESSQERGHGSRGEQKGMKTQEIEKCMEFVDDYILHGLIPDQWKGIFVRFGEQIYFAPQHTPDLQKIRVLRPGLHMGSMKKNRFEPSHSLALALHPQQVKYMVNLPADGETIRRYLAGETFSYEGENGWYLICADGYSIGWGKLSAGVMKNHYPKGLRNRTGRDKNKRT